MDPGANREVVGPIAIDCKAPPHTLSWVEPETCCKPVKVAVMVTGAVVCDTPVANPAAVIVTFVVSLELHATSTPLTRV